MKIKQALTNFTAVFVLTVIVSSIVTLLFSLAVHGAGTID